MLGEGFGPCPPIRLPPTRRLAQRMIECHWEDAVSEGEWDLTIVETVREALQQETDEHQASTRIRALIGDPAGERYSALVRALDYLRTKRPDETLAADRVYAPMLEFKDGGRYPEKPSEASDATISAWFEAFNMFSDSDLLRARLGDLLWLRKAGSAPHECARSAHRVLRQLAKNSLRHALSRAEDLVRALDIAGELGDRSLVSDTVPEAVAAAQASLSSSDWQPGVSMTLLTRLVRLPVGDRPAELEALLLQATQRHQSDPFVLQAIIELRLELAGANNADRRAVVLQALQVWERAARDAEGLVAQTHLRRALEIARREGLADEAERLVLLIQSADLKDLDLERVSGTVELPAGQIEAYIEAFVAGDDRQIWLGRLTGHCPVRSDRDTLAQEIRSMIAEYPLQFLFSRTVVNAEGLPLKEISGEEEQLEHAIRENDTRGIGIWGIFIVEILDRLVDKQLASRDLIQFLSAGPLSDAQRGAIGRAYEHYVAGSYEEALLVCVPRIEAVLREVAKKLDVVVYREPGAGVQVGGYKALGELLRSLKGKIYEPHRRYLELLLSDPLGPNLRNLVMHGLMLDVSKTDTALVLHAALILGTWRVVKAGPENADEQGAHSGG
jgi:hypothetical protein